MCDFFSGICMKDKKVLYIPGVDYHHRILEEFNVSDDTSDPQKAQFFPFEITPPRHPNGVFSPFSEWSFRIDARIHPEWVSPAHEEACWEALKEYAEEYILVGKEIDKIQNKEGLFLLNCKIGELRASRVIKAAGSTSIDYVADGSFIENLHDDSTIKILQASRIAHMYDASVVESTDIGAIVYIMHDVSTIVNLQGESHINYMCDNSIVTHILDFSSIYYMHDKSTIGSMLGNSIVHHVDEGCTIQEIWDNAMAIWPAAEKRQILCNTPLEWKRPN